MTVNQGLIQLREYAAFKGLRFHNDEKAIVIPIYSFINQLVTSIKLFLNCHDCSSWYIYLVNQHLHDRSFPNIIKSWQKLSQTSLQCHLLQTLLIVTNRNKLKMYLKARKFIIQTASNSAMLDQILLNVQDSISVIHKIYTNQKIRKALVQGIKNIFMAFKMSEAKIYSSVFIEYLLAIYDSIFKIQNDQTTISGQYSNYKSYENSDNYIELYSSISNFQSGIHNDNGLYKKTNFSQHTPKKYQIIDRKFIPLKETSQYISNQKNNQHSSLQKSKQSFQKHKSSFYDFISQTSQHDQHPIYEQQSSIQQINSFSKSYEKQYRYFLQKQSMQRRNVKPINEKENNILSKKFSMQRQTTKQTTNSNPKLLFHRPANQSSSIQLNNNLSMSWFSKKQFETSGDEQKQSLLRRSKKRIQKDAQQRKRHQTNFDSTEKYEIQNHILHQNNSQMGQSGEDDYYSNNKYEDNSQQKVQSVKREEFEKMVTKNQQFKQKMLKKNYPSITSNVNSSRKFSDSGNAFTSQSRGHQATHLQFQSESFSEIDGRKQFAPNNSIGLKRDHLPPTSLSPHKNQMSKEKNNKLSNSRNLIYPFAGNPNHSHSKEKYQKLNIKTHVQQDDQDYQQRPQIIHKSIAQIRQNNFSHRSQNRQTSHENVFEQDQESQQHSMQEKNSFQVNKMKKIIEIIDSYRDNSDYPNQSQQFHLSQTFCKNSNSNFDSNLNHDEIQNYSFY